MQRIKFLDSMRGLAAAVVVFHHAFTHFPELFDGRFPLWVQQGFQIVSELNVQAVLFFFFLSGFSICLSLKNALPVNKEAFNNYVYRRLKRILPLYYFSLLFTFLIGFFTNASTGDSDYSTSTLLGNIFFLQCSKSYAGNWFAPYGGNGPLWSLSFEMFYYFFLPLFLVILFKSMNAITMDLRPGRIALVCALIISVGCVVINKIIFSPFVAFTTLFYVWYVGFFTASLHVKSSIKIDLNFLLLLSLTALLLLMNYTMLSATAGKLLFGSAIATAFIPLFILRKKMHTTVALVFEKPLNFLFQRIGTGSYALYLLHFPVLLFLKHVGCKSLVVLVPVLMVTAVGCIWIEHLFSKSKWIFLKRNYIQ